MNAVSSPTPTSRLPEIGLKMPTPRQSPQPDARIQSTAQSNVSSQVELSRVSSVATVLLSTTSLLRHATSELETNFLSTLQKVCDVTTDMGRATFSSLFLPPLPTPLQTEQRSSESPGIGGDAQKGDEIALDLKGKGNLSSASRESFRDTATPSPSKGRSRLHSKKSLSSPMGSTSSMKKMDPGKPVKGKKDKQKEGRKVLDADQYCKPG